MKVKVILSTTLLVLLGASLVWAGDPWKEKPYYQWTEKDVRKVLENSPWSRVEHHRIQTSYSDWERVVRITVRWDSSRTVREALRRRTPSRQLAALQPHVGSLPRYYAIFVTIELGFYDDRENRMQYRNLFPEKTAEAYLQPRRSKQKIASVHADRPYGKDWWSYAEGDKFGLRFYFPRKLDGQLVIGRDEKKVRFHCKMHVEDQLKEYSSDYGSAIKLSNIQVEFDLRKMVRDGEPDL